MNPSLYRYKATEEPTQQDGATQVLHRGDDVTWSDELRGMFRVLCTLLLI